MTNAIFNPALSMTASFLDDVEGLRKASANRHRILTRPLGETDADGKARGFGMPDIDPDVMKLVALREQLDLLEEDTIRSMNYIWRANPLRAWQKSQRGVGEKTLARLLAVIGDPYINLQTGQPRTVGQLWAYCGLHTIPGEGEIRDAARRRKGEKANWSTQAKTRAYIIIEGCMKQIDKDCKGETGIGQHVDGCKCSKYRKVVDTRRQHTLITHSEWNPGHSLNDGIRIAMKELLKDLWTESRRIHTGE